jgi:hypothetical protein
MRTLILGAVERAAQDLERASDIEGVVVGIQGEQNLDDLNGAAIGAISNCTHLD